jgi:hypothetical protein
VDDITSKQSKVVERKYHLEILLIFSHCTNVSQARKSKAMGVSVRRAMAIKVLAFIISYQVKKTDPYAIRVLSAYPRGSMEDWMVDCCYMISFG